jgi:hypothetical protein
VQGASDYPLVLTLDAVAKTTAGTGITSAVTIEVARLMEETLRKRVTDALTYGGYPKFVPALRALPSIGTIGAGKRVVTIRYAREEQGPEGRRLVLVADRPLFFLAADPQRSRAGYELTIVELQFDSEGRVTGTIAGAARVKTSPDGPVLDDFGEAPVRLSSHAVSP